MKIKINDDLKNILPNFQVIAYTMDVDNLKTKEVENKLEEIKQKYFNIDMLPNVVSIPKIKESRDGYKKLGKDPSHTRLACEALYRRVLKGDGLYRLGDIIDLGNILSVEIKRSVCVVDERCELFPFVHGVHCFEPGPRTDILTACSKANGILLYVFYLQ